MRATQGGDLLPASTRVAEVGVSACLRVWAFHEGGRGAPCPHRSSIVSARRSLPPAPDVRAGVFVRAGGPHVTTAAAATHGDRRGAGHAPR